MTLYTGEQVLETSEAWRAECEARYVLAKGHAERHDFLTLIGAKRGTEAVERIRQHCLEVEPYFVLGLPNKRQRQHYIEQVELRFGPNPRKALEGKILAIHHARVAALDALPA
ncbi:hypothetical protein [Kaistia sp. 32K]|uniref:DUF7696 family protein n=1 Tax=Kaistia sp. 32K TaxID=2795690 RepID=UPI001915668B|nr:hypothetical protein [Kaistia sp. 32K]